MCFEVCQTDQQGEPQRTGEDPDPRPMSFPAFGGETSSQTALLERSWTPHPGGVPDQVGWVMEQLSVVEGIPSHGRGMEQDAL